MENPFNVRKEAVVEPAIIAEPEPKKTLTEEQESFNNGCKIKAEILLNKKLMHVDYEGKKVYDRDVQQAIIQIKNFCKSKNINPNSSDFSCILRGGKLTFTISYLRLIDIATSNSNFGGFDCQWAPDNSYVECIVYFKDGRHSFTHRCWAAEFKGNGGIGKPLFILEKNAIVQALRFSFPDSVGVGVYSEDEEEMIANDEKNKATNQLLKDMLE